MNLVINDAQISLWMSTLWLPFLRIGAALMVSPLFSSDHIPAPVRIFIPMAVVAVLLPTLPAGIAVNPLGVQGVLLAMNEILLGICLGFLLQLTFESVSLAGQLISSSMGLSFAMLVDPQQGNTVSVLSQFLLLLTMLLFMALNGHLAFLAFLAHSFTVWPVGHSLLASNALPLVIAAMSEMLSSALHIALPAMIALIVVQLAIGVVSRSAPSLNLFAVGFPLTILLGLLVSERSLPNLTVSLQQQLDHAFEMMQTLLQSGVHGRL